jgi:transcriptional regulator with XRE-family HTH domain
MKTVEFLDALRARHGLPSDYALAALLGVTRQTISKYRNGADFFGDQMAVKVAGLLELDPCYVMACAHAERATDEHIRSLWSRLASSAKKVGRKGGATVAAGILSVAFSGGPDAHNPDEHGAKSPSLILRAGSTLYTSWKVSAAKIGRLMRAILEEMPTPEHA